MGGIIMIIFGTFESISIYLNGISIKILHSIEGLEQTSVFLFQQKLNKTNLLEGSEVEFFLETYLSKNGPFNNFLV